MQSSGRARIYTCVARCCVPSLTSSSAPSSPCLLAPYRQFSDNVLGMHFVRFANFLGFATPLIPEEGVEGLMIQKLLLEIRPPEIFAIGQQQRQNTVKSIYSCILNGYLESRPSASPEVKPDERSQITGSVPCGRPSQSSYRHVKTRCFYLNIYDDAFKPNLSNNSYIFELFFGQDSLQSFYNLFNNESTNET